MMIGKWLGSVRTTGNCEGMYYSVRTMVGKASNRSGVHGSRLPDAKSLDNVISNYTYYQLTETTRFQPFLCY